VEKEEKKVEKKEEEEKEEKVEEMKIGSNVCQIVLLYTSYVLYVTIPTM